MTSDQVVGLVCVLVGVYLLTCSIFARNFVLYRMKIRRAAGVFGDKFAHAFFGGLGAVLLLFGAFKLAGGMERFI